MKALLATGIGSAALALSTFAAAPAQASPYSLDTMSSNMMTASDASTLGVAGNHIRDFRYLEGTQESPDDFWLQQRIHLGDDTSRSSILRNLHLVFNRFKSLSVKAKW